MSKKGRSAPVTLALYLGVILIVHGGCSLFNRTPTEPPQRAAIPRPRNVQAPVEEISVSRSEYRTALQNIGSLSRIRLIEVVASEENRRGAFPEYRMFSIAPASVYDLLGFEEGDILVSANDFALNDPNRFIQYVQYLHVESGEVLSEIRRAGKAVILKWTFTD
jgi:type II secretory pathway component PulC